MVKKMFRARLNRSQGRKGWCAMFRHPIRMGNDGKIGLRVRRGLGTDDEVEANSLIDQLNVLLSDESYWRLSAKDTAVRTFDPRVVKIFYDNVESKAEDPWLIREDIIQMPSREDGYARIQLVGATGAGKTTLLRQLIGSHPTRDRFPSISTAKTTIFDTEIILMSGPYRCVVSFLPRDRTRSYIEECVFSAVSAAAEGSDEALVIRRLFEHSEQRFRLSYLLGTLSTPTGRVEEWDDEQSDDEVNKKITDDQLEISSEDRERMVSRLTAYIQQIHAIAKRVTNELCQTLSIINVSNLKSEERDAFLELLEDYLAEDEETQLLVEDILSDVETKFAVLDQNTLDRDIADWPRRWRFETEDRSLFIKTINRFSSNYAPNFGKLLAPVVQGLRVAGPFRPVWFSKEDEVSKFVFIDGEGLGHTPASASTLPTSVTRRYDSVDVILLVDNATQPMQAASQAVLRSAAAGGHDAKLAIAFTHFDEVKGDNLPDGGAKRDHVLSSLDNGLNAIEIAISGGSGRKVSRNLRDRVFFLSNIQEVLSERARGTKRELLKLVKVFKASVMPTVTGAVVPIYDVANLVLSIRLATEQFHDHWNARLGLDYKPEIAKEHWARIKALSRRYAFQWEDEYDSLRPVADLIRHLSERLAAFLSQPRAWEPDNSRTPEEKEAAIGQVAREVYTRLHILVRDRLFQDHLNIYDVSAPVPGETPAPAANSFLDVVRALFREACEVAGAKVIG
jgi:energy-coupling factor transporter ATP-binding protein EcfA2